MSGLKLCIYVSDGSLEMTSSLLVGAALRVNTHKTYGSAQKKILNFCHTYHYTVLPAADVTLLNFVSYLFQLGLKGTSIKVYLAAVRSLHIMHNFPPPIHSDRLLLALKGAVHLSGPPKLEDWKSSPDIHLIHK